MLRRRVVFVVAVVLAGTFLVFFMQTPMINVWKTGYTKSAPRTRYESRRTVPSTETALSSSDTSFLGKLREFGKVDLPSKEDLRKMSVKHLSWTYHSYIDNVNILCHRKLRMGRIGDGGWEICDDVEYRPTQPCLVYSFGINYDFTFDDDIARFYGCQVFSFDPSMKRVSHQRPSSVLFLPVGVGGHNTVVNTTGWNLLTLHSIKTFLKHKDRVIDVLKMDVEGSEWESLRNMIKSHDLSRVRQLLVEFHMYGEFKTKSAGVAALDLLTDIHNIGFRKFYVHKNPGKNLKKHTFTTFRTPCYEVHFVNVKLKDVT